MQTQDPTTQTGLFLHSTGPLPTGINRHWKPKIGFRNGKRFIKIDLSEEGAAYRSQMEEAMQAYLAQNRPTQARLDYAYCAGEGLGVLAVLYFPDNRSDLDGPLKLAIDACVSGIDLDDDQIGLVVAFKQFDAVDPRMELWVGTLEDTARLALRHLFSSYPDLLTRSFERDLLRVAAAVDATGPAQSFPTPDLPHTGGGADVVLDGYFMELPDPPSFNKAWRWRMSKEDGGRVRPLAYLSEAYTRYKQRTEQHLATAVVGEEGERIARVLASNCNPRKLKENPGLGLSLRLRLGDGDTDNYIKPTLDAVVDGLVAQQGPLAVLKRLNDRYVTFLATFKERSEGDSRASLFFGTAPDAAYVAAHDIYTHILTRVGTSEQPAV